MKPKTLKGLGNEKARAAEKRITAFSLYKAGFSLREVGKQMGVSHTLIARYIHEELDLLADEHKKLGSQILHIELKRLDDMIRILWPKVLRGEEKAMDRVLNIMVRRAKYLRLDAPEQHEFSVTSLEDLVLGAHKKED